MNFRIGEGYDVHRLTKGRKLILGGVEIQHDKGLDGHSDADVLVHAIMDALLGAVAVGDIGVHFPESDLRYKGISSLVLLHEVRKIIEKKGFEISNIDSTIVAQKPKLAPFIPKMKELISRTLKLELNQVSVKATTTEGMGFEGTESGMSARAIALVYKKNE